MLDAFSLFDVIVKIIIEFWTDKCQIFDPMIIFIATSKSAFMSIIVKVFIAFLDSSCVGVLLKPMPHLILNLLD